MAKVRIPGIEVEKGFALQKGIPQNVNKLDIPIPGEKRASEFKLLKVKTLYNGLYNSVKTRITLNNRLTIVPEFPVAYVEIYKDRRRIEPLYVVIPYRELVKFVDPPSATYENMVKEVLRQDLHAYISTRDVKMYSDTFRSELFTFLFDKYFFDVGAGILPKPPNPNWVNMHLLRVIDDIIRDSFAFQDVEYLFFDDDIEDIFVNGYNRYILAKSREFNDIKTSIYATKQIIERFENNVSLLAPNVKFNEKHPVLDVQIEGYFNVRVNLTYGGSDTSKGFSVDGVSITLRKANEIPPSIAILLDKKYHSINEEVGAILFEFVHRGISALFFGETGSGKTTLLKALLTLAPPSARRVSLEDTVELPNLQKWGFHHVRLHAKSPLSKTSEDDWDMERGSKNLLRMRPEIAVLGEIRYTEAKTLFEMAQMGVASVYSTAHGGDPIQILQRLVHNMGVEPSSITSIDSVVLLQTLRPYGYPGIIRRVTNVTFLEDKEWQRRVNEITLSSGEEKKTFLIKSFVTYFYRFYPREKRLEERWDVDWGMFLNSKIAFKIISRTGMDYEILAEEIADKYNFLKASKKGVIRNDFEAEFNRMQKWVNVYHIVKYDGYSGREFWVNFVKEMKYQYGINVNHRWEDWIMDDLKKIGREVEDRVYSTLSRKDIER